MLIDIHPATPEERKIAQAAALLQKNGVIIIPTDSVYCFACALGSSKALEKMARIRDISLTEANFSLICKDLSQVSEYTAPVPQPTFKLMKRALPGPFTFILDAGVQVPRLFRKSKREVGIRIPDHNIPRALVEALGKPLVVSSVHSTETDSEYMTDPGLVHEKYTQIVDAVVAGGIGNIEPSTVVDCTGDEAVMVRPGRGVL
ncbi:L-threonylcarbamoyladenylate synthase [Flavobacteriales bacterium]|nr:L-threonylcarbamoyladenylate synthase [Flavobacteriales bacterium]